MIIGGFLSFRAYDYLQQKIRPVLIGTGLKKEDEDVKTVPKGPVEE